MTSFFLLGPLEAVADGEPVRLPRGKPRALLARLLLDADRVVAAETLVEALWGERPPASARKLLQVYVSQLRNALGFDQIETRAPGYLIRVGAEDYDLGRFQALTEAARRVRDPASRGQTLREALTLWRGPALAEFRDEPFAVPAGRRLAELHLNALEQRIGADLELGEHAAVVPELEALVAQEPLREGPLRQLMLALYRSGRQAEALARYREARRLFVGELGIEPSPALEELERAILRQDAALDELRTARRRARGAVVCVGAELHPLLAPLCGDGRELLIVEIADTEAAVAARSAKLIDLRESLIERGIEARIACFTSPSPANDLARLAAEQEAELLVLSGLPRENRIPGSPCDVAIAPRPDLSFEASDPVLVPFGGARDEWAAVELAAWLARAHRLPLRLLGARARGGRRDASRLLASASLALQRFAGTAAEPVLVDPGAEGVLAEQGAVLVTSLPPGKLDATRRIIVERTAIPVVLVRGGLRPSGLAPDQTLTRFSWSLAYS